ncbi:MAG: hypothetical protein AB7G47_16925 [Mycolicibacterium sp.]|uniref:hypothetical protein n=1 Tax=Mycolicibacterium sp. TaxID=2320850 RepID=UPI003D0B218E
MRTAFAGGRYEVVGESAAVEYVDVPGAFPTAMMRRIDEVAVTMRMRTDERFEHRPCGRVEHCCDVMASATTHTQ